MTQGKVIIKSETSERKLIECCLMYHHSGYDYKLILLFHALAHSWNYKKLIYYVNLIEGR